MGAIDSLNLFDLDELIVFCFYRQNRSIYRRVLDLGANLGLHSIILSKCGYSVDSYEPDPLHFEMLERNLTLNRCTGVKLHNLAVSDKDGVVDFIRVLGNTTSSHIAGAKPNPYGKLERVSVRTRAFKKIFKGVDLVKMDVEGFEKTLILSTGSGDWKNTDGLLSVHDKENAKTLFRHFKKLGVSMFSQKIGWRKATSVNDLPANHFGGSLFVTAGQKMPWGN
jgi:FkbM family methyltransferase